MIEIILNGEKTSICENLTITDILKQYNLDPATTIVEKNKEFIKKNNYSSEIIHENDTIELIRFIGGG